MREANSSRFCASWKRRSSVDHAARKKTARRRKNVQCGEGRAPRGARETSGAEEPAGEKIGDAHGRRSVEASARGVACERRRVAGIGRSAQDLRQLPGIAQAEVEALARDRVQRLRGVAVKIHNRHRIDSIPRKSG